MNATLFLFLTALVLCDEGCTTVHQAQVESAAPSFDGNVQNSGIVSQRPDGAYVVTAHFRDRYNALVAIYGDAKLADGAPAFTPPIRANDGLTALPDGTWAMDKQAMVDMVTLSRLKRQGFKP